MKRLCFAILLLFCCSQPSIRANINDEIREQIIFHKNWVESNVPLPDTLSEEQLFIETARAIYSSCLEARYVDIIKYAGEKFKLSELIDYAEIRNKRIIDKDDFHAIQCLKLLWTKSKEGNLTTRYVTAYINMYLILTAPDYDEQVEWIGHFYETTAEMSKNNASKEVEELRLFAHLLHEAGSTFQRYENPLAFEKCRILVTDITKFYAQTHIISEVRAYIYEYIKIISSKFELYSNYYAYINQKLQESNDSVLMGKFPLSYLTEDNDDMVVSDTIDYTRAAIIILGKYYHSYHPDVMALKKEYLYSYDNNSQVTKNDINEIAIFSKMYYGDRSIEFATANSLLRSYDVWRQDFSNVNYEDDLEIIKSYLSEESFAYLNYLEGELATQVFCGHKEKAMHLLNAIQDIAKKKYSGNIVKELSFHGLDWYFQKNGIEGFETAFDDISQTYIDKCDEYANFEAVGLGLSLANTAQTIFNAPVTSLALQRKVLQIIEKLVGRRHPVFAFEYIRYGQFIASSYPVDALTLDGDNDEDALFSDIISISQMFECSEFAMVAAGRRKSMQGSFREARNYFNQAISVIEAKYNTCSLTDDDKESDRYYLACLYSYLLQTFFAENSKMDSVDYYGKRLVEKFADGFRFNPDFHSEIYSTLITYYMQSNHYHDAEALLNKCMAYYDSNPNRSIDGFYIQVMQALVQLYGNAYGDMDKCLLIAEKAERDIENIRDLGNMETYIGFLRTLYDLVEYKNPYDLPLLIKYLQPLDKAITQYVQSSKNEMVFFNHGIYLFTKLVRFARDEPQYRTMAIVNTSEDDYERNLWLPLKNNLVDNILPMMMDMKEKIENKYPSAYKQSPIYQQLILNLAIVNQRCIKDIRQAEEYLILLSQCNEQIGLLQLGNFYLETNDVVKSAQIFSQCENTILQQDTIETSGFFSGIRSQIYSRIFMAYYRAGKYEKALNAANIYYDNIQSQINTNFDLLTQTERESFLMQFGAGGTPLQMLLPHIGEEISSKVYDILLQEKGLLLRTSNKIRESILASRNDTLVHAIDSLQIYQQELSLLANVPESQNKYMELRERYDKLERYVSRASKQFRKEDNIPNWEQVRRCLNKGEAAIEFLVTDSVSMALILTPETEHPISVRLLHYNDMKALLDLTIANQNEMSKLAVLLYKTDTLSLYEKLWLPIERFLDGIQTVYYSPSGILNILSFAAIPLPTGGNLIDKYELHQLTSTGNLVSHKSNIVNVGKPKSATIYGAILYSDEQRINDSSFISKIRNKNDYAELLHLKENRGAGAVMKEFPFPFLRNTLVECDAVTTLLNNSDVTTNEIIGEMPTESELRKLDGNSPDIIHISTHGFFVNSKEKANVIPFFRRFNQLNSMLCTGLLLANSEKAWLQENNILSSSEISSMKLENTKLIVLSACETALGSFGTEGVFGLQRGFKQAGVRSICASLWSVDDLSTSQLMQSFYNIWLSKYNGREMQKALRDAMLIQRTKTPSPEYWAPFVLYDADF